MYLILSVGADAFSAVFKVLIVTDEGIVQLLTTIKDAEVFACYYRLVYDYRCTWMPSTLYRCAWNNSNVQEYSGAWKEMVVAGGSIIHYFTVV